MGEIATFEQHVRLSPTNLYCSRRPLSSPKGAFQGAARDARTQPPEDRPPLPRDGAPGLLHSAANAGRERYPADDF